MKFLLIWFVGIIRAAKRSVKFEVNDRDSSRKEETQTKIKTAEQELKRLESKIHEIRV